MNYILYKSDTGEITRNISCPENMIESQLNAGEGFIEGTASDETQYISQQSIVNKSEKPDWFYDYDYQTHSWVVNETKLILQIMQQRNSLLIGSDWTQIPNGPLTIETQEQWAVYRQQLRDITSQSGYPFNVVWPTQPE
jgi:hypothetical protein